MVQLFRGSLLLTVVLGLTACGGNDSAGDSEGAGLNIANLVGTQKNPPDEFAVNPTAPLELPKDFTTLPPPNPGQRSPLISDPVSEARATLLGGAEPKAASARVSASESALLSASGSAPPSNIREVLEAEQAENDADDEVYVLDRIFPSLRATRGADAKDTLQPEEERERLSTLAETVRTNSDGIATIAGPAVSAPAPPVATPTGEELIYITE